MKIVNKTKFVRTISVFIILLGLILIFSKNTYSKGEITYKEDYIYAGDTLWNIAEKEIENNKYFANKEIRAVVDELKTVNNFKSSELYEGEKIKIPIYK